MRNSNYNTSSFILSLGLVWAVAGCKPLDVQQCVLDSVSTARAQRWIVGDSIVLPAFRLEDSDCASLEWTIVEAPKQSSNQLLVRDEDYVFTADRTGQYRFQVIDEDAEYDSFFTLKVGAETTQAFHNYNYYPSPNALISVGNEVWAVGVYSPQLARLSDSDGTPLDPIAVGPWPVALAHAESEGLVLVAQQANDRLGLVDTKSRQIVDAIWVGDEPRNVVWDSKRQRAYVALGGANAVAIVDIPNRRLIKTVDAVFDPLGLALDIEQSRLFVASHRSGQTVQYPYPSTKLEDEKDIAIIDLESQTLVTHILEVASTINHLSYEPENQVLWVAATSNDIEGQLNDPETPSFKHELFSLKPQGGPAQRTQSVDLSRQPTSSGSAANIHGFTRCGSEIYVAAESSNAVVVLDTNSLEETRRIKSIDTPRSVLCTNSRTLALSSNPMTVVALDEGGTAEYKLKLSDPRDPELVMGFSVFHSAGVGVADNRSCSSCHVNAMSDGVIWNAGPIVNQQLTRPLRWLEGTSRIGWDGYVGSVKISGYVGGSTINLRPTTTQAMSLGKYLASLMPPPPANAWTERDGRLTEQAERGEKLFSGKASCLGCHPGPVSTSRIAFENGFTPGKTDVPTLVDVARIGAWYKNGEKRTIDSAVRGALDYLGLQFSEAEQAELTRYIKEMTAREFFVLSANLEPSAMAVPVDREFKLTFSYPLDAAPQNISSIRLSDASGQSLEATLRVDGRHLYLKPVQSLMPETAYTIELTRELFSQTGRRARPELIQFVTASLPAMKLEGSYTLTINSPALDFATQSFDLSRTIPSTVMLVADPEKGGASVQIDFGQDLEYEDFFVIDGEKLLTKDLPIPVGPAFGNGSGLIATLVDSDDDGIADSAEGTIVLSGPGFDLKNVGFELKKLGPISTECNPGNEGDYTLTVDSSTTGVIINWGDVPALGLYVTSPGANLPGGPGQMISGGEAYFVLEASGLDGFRGPISYGIASSGAQDKTEFHGGLPGGASLEEGTCYQFTVFTQDFKFSRLTREW